MNKIKKIIQIAKSYFQNPVAGHDWFHVERVYKNAFKIGKNENADMDILEAAVFLHDIARKKEDMGKTECHAKEGAKMAKTILKSLDYREKDIEEISEAIKDHRYREQIKPKTQTGRILQDADRLDALGAVSIARIFSYGGEHKRPIYDPKIPPKSYYDSNAATSLNHFFEKIFHLKPAGFHTKLGQEIAKERYTYIQNFVKRFLKEWSGEL